MNNQTQTKKYVVYQIQRIKTGRSYFGQTNNFNKRMSAHKKSQDGFYIHNAIRKHGINAFTYNIIYECETLKEIKSKEKLYIKEFNTFENGYNLTTGGEGYKHSIETRKKMSGLAKGRKASNKTRKKLSDAGKNRKHSEETRKKMSESAKNRPLVSEKTRKKISTAATNPSTETRKKMSGSHKGKTVSLETRKKMSESRKKLSDNQVLEIRQMLSNDVFQKIIAQKFNVVQSTIGCIKRNECYANIQLSTIDKPIYNIFVLLEKSF